LVSLVLVLALGVMGCSDESDSGGGGNGGEVGFPEAEAAALEAAEEYLEAFNACGDGNGWEAWAATLNYPHIRFDSTGSVTVWDTPEEYLASFICEGFRLLNPDWDHSTWDSVEIVQSGPDKVHIAILANRRDAEGNVLETFQTFHIMTDEDGHWGTLSRSSFAPQ
jgi:hypothetical protein